MGKCPERQRTARTGQVAVLSIVLGLSVAHSSAFAAEDYRYAMLRLPTLGGDTGWGFGINNLGQVTGTSDIDGNASSHPYLFHNGSILDYGLPDGAAFASGKDINEFGNVTGSYTATEIRSALWRRDGEIIDLGGLGGTRTRSQALNDHGQIVGYATVLSGESRAFIWQDGVMTELGTLGGDQSWAYDINNWGLVVGETDLFNGRTGAFLWENGVMRELTWYENQFSYARAINDLGAIVGHGTIDDRVRLHPILWYQNEFHVLRSESAFGDTWPSAISDHWEIVGYTDYRDHLPVAIHWSSPFDRPVRVKDLIPPRSHWISIYFADDINDAGQFTGTGKYGPEGDILDTSAYIVTPVHPTIEMSQPAPGIAGQVNTVIISNLEPGERAIILYGARGGGAVIPGCDLQQNAVQIEDPKLAGWAIADENGNVEVSGLIPEGQSGKILLFQAVVPRRCAISNLIVTRFE